MSGLDGWSAPSRAVRLALAAALALPLATPAAEKRDAPPGWQVVNAVGSGRALATRKPQARTVNAALRATLADLAVLFGRPPVVRGAYEDARDHRSGGAGFRAELRGRPVQGLITCEVAPEGAVVAVVYAAADAPRSEWIPLLRARPGERERAGAERPAPRPGVASVPLRTYRFPDGTGSIGLAEGWRTEAQSCAGPVHLQGPRDQAVSMGQAFSVSTPDSMAAQTQRQLAANARQMGSPPPALDLLVAPYAGPLEAVRSLAPQLSRLSARHGGPPFQLDRLALAEVLPGSLPGGQAARLTYGVSEQGKDGRVRHYRAEAYAETARVGPGGWMLMIVVQRAPDATFDADLPVMRAMVFSLQENAQAIQQKTQQQLAAQNQWFQAQQRAHRQQVEGFEAQQRAHREVQQAYDRKNRGWEANQNALARSHDDYDEVLRGYRTVEDSRTGVKTSVELGNVDAIVDKLNEADPGRYRQIPLRDELDPLPAR